MDKVKSNFLINFIEKLMIMDLLLQMKLQVKLKILKIKFMTINQFIMTGQDI